MANPNGWVLGFLLAQDSGDPGLPNLNWGLCIPGKCLCGLRARGIGSRPSHVQSYPGKQAAGCITPSPTGCPLTPLTPVIPKAWPIFIPIRCTKLKPLLAMRRNGVIKVGPGRYSAPCPWPGCWVPVPDSQLSQPWQWADHWPHPCCRQALETVGMHVVITGQS